MNHTASDDLLPTRRSLLSRLKQWDDQESWRDFFHTYWKIIYGTARKSGLSDAEAQEVVQETVIAVSRKIERFTYDPKKDSFKGWLLWLTRRAVANQYRRRHREQGGGGPHPHMLPLSEAPETMADPAGFDLEAIWQAEWEGYLMQAALARIRQMVDPRQYQAFDWQVLKQRPAREVARRLRMSLPWVYLTRHKIAKLLEKEIRKLQAGEQ